jgi:hypothetical protein
MKPDYQRLIASPAEDRRDLFVATGRNLGIAEQNVEKDFGSVGHWRRSFRIGRKGLLVSCSKGERPSPKLSA